MDQIRKATNSNFALGNDRFSEQSNSNKRDNTMTSNRRKAQGKGFMHPVLTEVSLRNC